MYSHSLSIFKISSNNEIIFILKLLKNQGNYGDTIFLFFSDVFVSILARNICVMSARGEPREDKSSLYFGIGH